MPMMKAEFCIQFLLVSSICTFEGISKLILQKLLFEKGYVDINFEKNSSPVSPLLEVGRIG